MTTTPIDLILSLLSKVRRRQPHQFSAICPAHEDKSPSLSVRQKPDGSVLIHCFGGCSIYEITAALGLDMSDLYPPSELSGREPKRINSLLKAPQALELLDDEANLVAIASAGLGNGVLLSEEDLIRVLKASGRISLLRGACMNHGHA
jgi:CHC2 zinc finger